jgi:hypothetical protein
MMGKLRKEMEGCQIDILKAVEQMKIGNFAKHEIISQD